MVHRFWYGKRLGFLAFQAFTRLDPQIEFQFAVNAIHTFMVPDIAFDVSQIQKAQAEAPVTLTLRQPQEQMSYFIVVTGQLPLVPITTRTNPKSHARLPNAQA